MKPTSSVPVSGIFPAECFHYAADCGVEIAPLLAHFDLSPEPTLLASQEIELDQLQGLMRALWQAFPYESLGLAAGMRIPPTAFGSFGYAFICSRDLESALNTILKYWVLVGRGVSLQISKEALYCTLTFGNERDTESFLSRWMIEAGIATCWRALNAVLPEVAATMQINVGFPAPLRPLPLPMDLPMIRYDSAFNQISFPTALLRNEFPLHSPKGLQQAIKQCDAQLELRGPAEWASRQLRGLLGVASQGFPSLASAAAMLGMSTRTLRRRLALEQTSYIRLLQEARMLDATHLLRNRTLTIADIALRLGYQEEASFCRAFRRWTQKTPTQARHTLSAAPDTSVTLPPNNAQ